MSSAIIRGEDVLVQLIFTPLIAGWSVWLGIAISTRVSDVRVAQQLSVLASLPTVALTTQRPGDDNVQVGQAGPSPWLAGLDVDDFGGSVPKLVQASGSPTPTPPQATPTMQKPALATPRDH